MKRVILIVIALASLQINAAEIKLSILGSDAGGRGSESLKLVTSDSKSNWEINCNTLGTLSKKTQSTRGLEFDLGSMCSTIHLCALYNLENVGARIELVLDPKSGEVKSLTLPGACL